MHYYAFVIEPTQASLALCFDGTSLISLDLDAKLTSNQLFKFLRHSVFLSHLIRQCCSDSLVRMSH